MADLISFDPRDPELQARTKERQDEVNARMTAQHEAQQIAPPVPMPEREFSDDPLTKIPPAEMPNLEGPLTQAPALQPRAANVATDYAVTETLAEGQHISLEARIANNEGAQGAFDPTNDNINNVVIEAAKRQFEEGIIKKQLGFEFLTDPNVPQEKKREILQNALRLMDLRKATLRETVAWSLALNGLGAS